MAEPTKPHGGRKLLIAALLAVVAIGAALWIAVLPGLSVARQEPSKLEVGAATFLLRHSVPAKYVKAANPLGAHPDPAEVTAGRDLFQKKCEVCHAYTGDGRTEIGAGAFPRPPVLRTAVQGLSDGEIFYHVRNGIRNTAMPAWDMPDRDLWRLVSYIRTLPPTAPIDHDRLVANQTKAVLGAQYVGSEACKSCHQETYDRWKKTRMANVVRDPAVHPDAIIPDMAKADPKLVNFTAKDIAFVYGSHWKQRYFHKVGDDYIPYPAQWEIEAKKWSAYHVKDEGDWWAKLFPDPKGDNSTRPTSQLCDGCHSVNYDIDKKQPSEWNVGCESCHGAGSAHAAHPLRDNILNPARQDYVHANDTCIQCHSQGQPIQKPIKGKLYDWPVGYKAGLTLADFWTLEEHKPGELSFTHFPDGSAHKNRMQGNDFVQSLMYERGVTCFSCHDPHGTDNEALLKKPVTEVCMSCHGANTQNGPHAPTIEAHTHHKAGSPGSQCVNCHMPKIAQEIGKVNVASHTFKFIPPDETEKLGVPNACTNCHQDKRPAWATAALKSWGDRSPWRVARP